MKKGIHVDWNRILHVRSYWRSSSIVRMKGLQGNWSKESCSDWFRTRNSKSPTVFSSHQAGQGKMMMMMTVSLKYIAILEWKGNSKGLGGGGGKGGCRSQTFSLRIPPPGLQEMEGCRSQVCSQNTSRKWSFQERRESLREIPPEGGWGDWIISGTTQSVKSFLVSLILMCLFFLPTAQYQMEMMRRLRAMNIDHHHVGWYQSTYLGSYMNKTLLESQFDYQNTIEESVVLIYGM